jgi:hypothetical protein
MIETIKAGSGPSNHETAESLGRERRPVVVIDGLSLLSSSERDMLELQGIVDRLRQLSQIGILVYEPSAEESTSLDHHADLVMELSSRTLATPMAYLVHEFWIKKARYQETALGQHQFKIRRSGLVFFPSVHFQVQHPSYMDFELIRSTAKEYKPALAVENNNPSDQHAEPPSGVGPFVEGSILDLIFDPKPGESIVLLGSRGTFKTELCLDFLAQGCPAERASQLDNGLLISLIDNSPNIEKGVACPWHRVRMCKEDCTPNAKCNQCADYILRKVRPFKQPPGCISSSELLHYLIEAVSRLKDLSPELSRLIFWDLTQLDYRFPLLKDDPMLLPAMMDVFKSRNLKSLFMGAENATNTPAANAMADNVIFCWRSKHKVRNITNKASQVPSRSLKWIQSGCLMLYVDRASSRERPAKSLYRIPIIVDKKDNRRECLKAPCTKKELDGPFHRIDWLKADTEDQEHINKIRRFQGLE